MNKRHERQADVLDEKLWAMCDELEARTKNAFKIVAELEQIAGEERRYKKGEAFCQVAMPAPEDNRDELRCYLRVFIHLRSPSFKLRYKLDLSEFSPETIANVREWIGELLRDYKRQPGHWPAWADYLQKALDAIDGAREGEERVRRQRKQNETLFGDW